MKILVTMNEMTGIDDCLLAESPFSDVSSVNIPFLNAETMEPEHKLTDLPLLLASHLTDNEARMFCADSLIDHLYKIDTTGTLKQVKKKIFISGPRKLEKNRVYGKKVATDLGLSVSPWKLLTLKTFERVLTSFGKGKEKVVVKNVNDQLFDIAHSNVILDSLKKFYQNPENSKDTFIVEEFFNGDIEFGITFICDGKDMIPLATVFDENRLFTSGLGPKFGDTGAVVKAGMGKKWDREIRQRFLPWCQKVKYRGLLDVDVLLKEDGQYIIMEYACRPGITTCATTLKLLATNPLDLFYAMAKKEKLPSIEFVNDWAFNIGLYTFSKEFPKVNGSLPKGEKVHSFEKYYLKSVKESSRHLLGIEVAYNQANTSLHLGDVSGRAMIAVATANSWKSARNKAYAIVDEVQYKNKVYRPDLFQNKLNNFNKTLKILNSMQGI